MRRLLFGMGSLLLGAPAFAQQTGGQTGFVSADTLPPGEQLPAAPLLIAAYAFVWLAAMFYVWTVWRRLNRVERDMRTLEKRHMPDGGPAKPR